MIKLLRRIIVLGGLVYCAHCGAWNLNGHVLVGDLANDYFSESEQREWDLLSYTLLKELGTDRRLYLARTYPNSSSLSLISGMPDTYASQPIADVFAQFEVEFPLALAPYMNQSWSQLSASRRPYAADLSGIQQCPLGAETPVENLLFDLITAYRDVGLEKGKALVLAYISNLVADLHQPLNTLSRINTECESDSGGAEFCASPRGATERCEQTLLELWDSGLNVWDAYENYDEAAASIRQFSWDTEGRDDLDPARWVDEGYRNASFIYSTQQNRTPDPFYLNDGKYIALVRLHLAAYRLSKILQQLD